VRTWGTHWESNGNSLGTHWELERNIVRTHWEPRKSPNLKGKKSRHLGFPLSEISIPKRVQHHFWPRLVRLSKNTLAY